jgi:hypothetical protein
MPYKGLIYLLPMVPCNINLPSTPVSTKWFGCSVFQTNPFLSS